MKEEFHDIEVIEKYLEGNLEGKRKEAFEKELRVNSELVEQVELYKKAIDELSNEGLRTHLKDIHNDLFMKSKNKQRWPYYLGVAASVLLLITFGYLFTNRGLSNETLFTTYFEPYPNLISTRNDAKTPFGKGMGNYSNHKYESAIQAFEEVSEDEQTSQDLVFYKGISYLALSLPNKAILSFEQVEHTTQYEEQLTWYLAMAYLKLDDVENTQKQLLKIQENSFKYAESIDLLKQIED